MQRTRQTSRPAGEHDHGVVLRDHDGVIGDDRRRISAILLQLFVQGCHTLPCAFTLTAVDDDNATGRMRVAEKTVDGILQDVRALPVQHDKLAMAFDQAILDGLRRQKSGRVSKDELLGPQMRFRKIRKLLTRSRALVRHRGGLMSKIRVFSALVEPVCADIRTTRPENDKVVREIPRHKADVVA